ncbi:hypothetical protein EDC02_2330 [Micromonospora sp. Llam0]|nr:hypothetical protein EDC02_2330 [Micromonospora sp. Llam0]
MPADPARVAAAREILAHLASPSPICRPNPVHACRPSPSTCQTLSPRPGQRQRRHPRRPAATPAHRDRLPPRRRTRTPADRPGHPPRARATHRERRRPALATDHPRPRRAPRRPRPDSGRSPAQRPTVALPQRPTDHQPPLRPPVETHRRTTPLGRHPRHLRPLATPRHPTWVERHHGCGIARAYAGHTDSTGPATTTYIKADLQTVAAALATMTGRPHPLATTAWTNRPPTDRLPRHPQNRPKYPTGDFLAADRDHAEPRLEVHPRGIRREPTWSAPADSVGGRGPCCARRPRRHRTELLDRRAWPTRAAAIPRWTTLVPASMWQRHTPAGQRAR